MFGYKQSSWNNVGKHTHREHIIILHCISITMQSTACISPSTQQLFLHAICNYKLLIIVITVITYALANIYILILAQGCVCWSLSIIALCAISLLVKLGDTRKYVPWCCSCLWQILCIYYFSLWTDPGAVCEVMEVCNIYTDKECASIMFRYRAQSPGTLLPCRRSEIIFSVVRM